MKKVLFLFSMFLVFSGAFAADYKNISVRDAFNILQQKTPDLLLLDVRTQEEYAGEQGHVKESKLIPVQVLEQNLNQIEAFREKQVLIICNSGNRSKMAASILTRNGFRDVTNIMGGILAWNEGKLPVEK